MSSLISIKSTIEGNCFFFGDVHVDGTFTGVLQATGTIAIGENGTCHGSIVSQHVIVGGHVYGDIIAGNTLVLLKNGRIDGCIVAPSIDFADKGSFSGFCHITPHVFDSHSEKEDETQHEIYKRALAALHETVGEIKQTPQ